MELRLQQLIANLEQVSNVRNLDSNNPIVVRISHPTNSKVSVIVCSTSEPNTLILPLNVIWFSFDPTSEYFRKALKRVSKTPSSPFQNTWSVITTYDEVFIDQYYDADDTELLTDTTIPEPATTTSLGIARLSYPAQVASNPVVVTDGDPRLSDARNPLPHDHPEVPATMLKTSQGVVTISGSEAPTAGCVLVATSDTTAQWRKLRSSDLA